MPTCRDCHGTGQRQIKIEITTRCPDCDGTKLLPDGTDCTRCNQWGEIGAGKFNVEKKLCTTCMGSGKVSEGSLTVWFLVRVVPASLLLLGVGGALIWLSWSFLGLVWLTTLLIVLVFGLWGGLMYYFIGQMPGIGEISPTNWFLMRVTPTTLISAAIGGAAVWSAWVYTQSMPLAVLLGLGAAIIWGVLMAYFILNLPE